MNNKKNLKKSTSLAIGTVAAIVIVILVNIFVGLFADKFNIKLDLTTNKLYELSDKTKEYLKTYDTPTDIYVLASEAEQDDRVRSVLDRYSALNRNISVRNINMKENPTFGTSYVKNGETLSTNSIIIDSGTRHKLFTRTQLHESGSGTGDSLNVENNVTAALRYVSSSKAFKVYLVKGHNEIDIPGAVEKLQKENFETSEIQTLTEEIPSDASMLILMNPTVDFSENEITKLDNYLSDGGHLQVYFNVGDAKTPNLFKYLSSWGIGVNNDVVLENDESKVIFLSNGSFNIPQIESSPFTESLIANKRSLAYITNRSKSLTQEFEKNGDISVMPLLRSSQNSFTSVNYEDVTEGINNSDGGYIVGALALNSSNNSSVYVSGNTFLLQVDETILSNDFGLANYDYFMNLINYSLDTGDSFTVNKKMILDGNITVSKSGATGIMIFVVIVIPAVVLLIGLVIWFRRRNL